MSNRRHPDWLKVKIPSGKEYHRIKSLLASSRLHTICEEAKCPNIAECFSKGTATFLILGDVCTRNCTYCNVKKGTPRKLDLEEPARIARIVKKLNLNYVVITSVTRDDLSDGGANIFARTIQRIKELSSKTKIEALIPDFQGNRDSLKRVINAKPYVLAHNLETVERLFPTVRPQGDYGRSLNLLKKTKEMSPCLLTKSGIMVGMREKKEEITEVMKDLREAGCGIFTIGQYLQPSLNHLPVSKYYTPEEFRKFKEIGERLGFLHVESGPLVRSSYHAGEYVLNHLTPTRW
jgi:lipoic acid synthetase